MEIRCDNCNCLMFIMETQYYNYIYYAEYAHNIVKYL